MRSMASRRRPFKKSVRDLISISKEVAKEELQFEKDPESMSKKELEKLIEEIEKKMKKAAAELNFEAAAELRDKMIELKKHATGSVEPGKEKGIIMRRQQQQKIYQNPGSQRAQPEECQIWIFPEMSLWC